MTHDQIRLCFSQKTFTADLKAVYKVTTKIAAEIALGNLETKWGKRYPVVIQFWRNKWDNLSAYFKYPDDVRTVIYYASNTVEAVHRQIRKLVKTKGGFANENSFLKLLCVGVF